MLVNCQACGAKISDTASACPQCSASSDRYLGEAVQCAECGGAFRPAYPACPACGAPAIVAAPQGATPAPQQGMSTDFFGEAQPPLLGGAAVSSSRRMKPLAPLRSTWNIMRWAFLAFIAARTVFIAELAVLLVLAELTDRGIPAAYDMYLSFADLVERWDNTLIAISLISFAASAATYLFFVYRALKNLNEANVPDVDTSPGFGAWSIFIPFVSWVAPFVAVRAILQGTSTAAGRPVPGAVSLGLWWAGWIIASLSSVALGYVERAAESEGYATMDSFRNVIYGNIGVAVAFVLSGLFFLRATRRIVEAWEASRQAQSA